MPGTCANQTQLAGFELNWNPSPNAENFREYTNLSEGAIYFNSSRRQHHRSTGANRRPTRSSSCRRGTAPRGPTPRSHWPPRPDLRAVTGFASARFRWQQTPAGSRWYAAGPRGTRARQTPQKTDFIANIGATNPQPAQRRHRPRGLLAGVPEASFHNFGVSA